MATPGSDVDDRPGIFYWLDLDGQRRKAKVADLPGGRRAYVLQVPTASGDRVFFPSDVVRAGGAATRVQQGPPADVVDLLRNYRVGPPAADAAGAEAAADAAGAEAKEKEFQLVPRDGGEDAKEGEREGGELGGEEDARFSEALAQVVGFDDASAMTVRNLYVEYGARDAESFKRMLLAALADNRVKLMGNQSAVELEEAQKKVEDLGDMSSTLAEQKSIRFVIPGSPPPPSAADTGFKAYMDEQGALTFANIGGAGRHVVAARLVGRVLPADVPEARLLELAAAAFENPLAELYVTVDVAFKEMVLFYKNPSEAARSEGGQVAPAAVLDLTQAAVLLDRRALLVQVTDKKHTVVLFTASDPAHAIWARFLKGLAKAPAAPRAVDVGVHPDELADLIFGSAAGEDGPWRPWMTLGNVVVFKSGLQFGLQLPPGPVSRQASEVGGAAGTSAAAGPSAPAAGAAAVPPGPGAAAGADDEDTPGMADRDLQADLGMHPDELADRIFGPV